LFDELIYLIFSKLMKVMLCEPHSTKINLRHIFLRHLVLAHFTSGIFQTYWDNNTAQKYCAYLLFCQFCSNNYLLAARYFVAVTHEAIQYTETTNYFTNSSQ